ncbi:alpha-protein kinase 1 [Drosophila mojavensis]|uniref:PIH1 N-terminal domain-containing protein n=1 Tax=Drosophila mojavensis TaxID=7230 RepID=B4KVV7_DROMO|nr:alpha-protein kinase 1 [Drosophila mojavensis]EDW18481.1 uncharacterized protein Dmoj_GI13266 [Drosophila mojavensis]
MSAAELETESSAQEQQSKQPQQQQQHNEHTSNNNSTANDAEANTFGIDLEETIETMTSSNNYNIDMEQQQLQHNNMQQHAQMQQQQQQHVQHAQQEQEQQLEQQGDMGLGMTLMQSSPPPHSYRHSRAYRHFKNPPQPHMCIRTTTETGEELFINVLSWTRIVIPQEPSDPIPLYGGMRVPPGSPRSPPIVFAVMANPEVLKDSGRHSKDPEERRAMVELMCDFVEAMNPGVKLVRNAVILKDRDISGELKDVWNAVQAQRDREREEQMLQQRQQQHYQNITTQQMFPKSPDAMRAGSAAQSNASEIGLPPAYNADLMTTDHGNGITLAVFAQQLDNKVASEQSDEQQQEQQAGSNESTPGDSCGDQTDAGVVVNGNSGSPSASESLSTVEQVTQEPESRSANTTTSNGCSIPTNVTTAPTPNAAAVQPTATPTPTPPATTPPPAAPVKKEKLGGFLPNGCIFPRFKNNKHKDKDGNHKESKSKEKTLLNALKKSKEKKVAPSEQAPSDKTATDNGTTQYEKNCINNLECEVQKLDLNSSNNDNNMFIKLKVAPSAASAAAAVAK